MGRTYRSFLEGIGRSDLISVWLHGVDGGSCDVVSSGYGSQKMRGLRGGGKLHRQGLSQVWMGAVAETDKIPEVVEHHLHGRLGFVCVRLPCELVRLKCAHQSCSTRASTPDFASSVIATWMLVSTLGPVPVGAL